jgi:hypothetical protein
MQTVTIFDIPGSGGGKPKCHSYSLPQNACISDLKICIERHLGYPRWKQELITKGSSLDNVSIISALEFLPKQLLLLKIIATPWLRFTHSCDSKTAPYYHLGLDCDFPILESLFYNTTPLVIWTGTHFEQMKCWFRNKLLFCFNRHSSFEHGWCQHIKNIDHWLFGGGTSIYIKRPLTSTAEIPRPHVVSMIDIANGVDFLHVTLEPGNVIALCLNDEPQQRIPLTRYGMIEEIERAVITLCDRNRALFEI